MLRIVITSGPEQGRSLNSNDLTEIEIGRQARHLRVTDARVSRIHCRIEKNDAGEWYISDCNSKRGTLHNGRVVASRARIVDGDMITIGHTVFRCFISMPVKAVEDPRMSKASSASTAAKAKSNASQPAPTQPTIKTTATQPPKPAAKRNAPPKPARVEAKNVEAKSVETKGGESGAVQPPKSKPVERAKAAPQPDVSPVSKVSKNGEAAADCWMDAIMSEMKAFDENEYDDESLD